MRGKFRSRLCRRLPSYLRTGTSGVIAVERRLVHPLTSQGHKTAPRAIISSLSPSYSSRVGSG
jgi:hypothetical protein